MKLPLIRRRHHTGFTLLELVIVIAIISILFTLIILVLNPAQRIAQAYDSNRLSDMNTLHKAIQQYYVEYRNYERLGISTTETEICDTRFIAESASGYDCQGFVNLSPLVPEFIVAVPTDPLNLSTKPEASPHTLSGNGYTVSMDDRQQITIRSLNLDTNTTALTIIKNVNIRDVRTQVVLIALIIVVAIGLSTYFVLRKNRQY